MAAVDFYHRDYENDFPQNENQYLRYTKALLPFISLYQPLGRIIAVGSSCARLYTSIASVDTKDSYAIAKSSFDVAMAVAAAAGTILFHPVGMMISTSHDMCLNGYNIYQGARNRDALQVAKECAKLGANTLFLAAQFYGTLEMQIASLGFIAIAGAVSSADEFKKGRWLEAGCEMAMSAIRVNQIAGKCQLLKQKYKQERAIKRAYVGTVSDKWQFPSDHLPVGVKIDGVKIVSWNVMNSQYMGWVTEKDSQGLNGSMISELHRPVDDKGLTERDVRVVTHIGTIIDKKSDIIALQECSTPFLQELETHLPRNWKVLKMADTPLKDQEVILYNSKKLTYQSDKSDMHALPFTSAPQRKLQVASFTKNDSDKVMRVYNSHIPGDPSLPCRQEFADYVKTSAKPGETIVALGDNNFERHEMLSAYQKSGFFNFRLFSPWHTNIDPYSRKSKGIDHILVQGETSSRQLKAGEILDTDSNLKDTITLLRHKESQTLLSTIKRFVTGAFVG